MYLGGVLLQLIVSPSSEGVCTDQTRFPAFLLIVVSQLGAGGGLPGPLQAHHHDHIGPPLDWDVGLDPRVYQFDQLPEDRLLYELPLVVALSHLLEVNTRPDILSEGFY